MRVYMNKSPDDLFVLAQDQDGDSFIEITPEERDVINKAETLFLNIQDFIKKKLLDKQIQ